MKRQTFFVVRAVLITALVTGCNPDPMAPTPASMRRAVQLSGSAVNGKIAFTSDRDGNAEIYVMNADGSGQTRLTNNSTTDGDPAWSPDGSKIAFNSNRDGNDEIYVMNADGSGQTRLTNNPTADVMPDWSPDGTKIAFFSNRHGNQEIYVMNADGSGQTRLTNNQVDDVSPDWSPDGSKIAFSHVTTYNNPDIFVMNADGSGQTNLTGDWWHYDVYPQWSPDGSKIAFVSTRASSSYTFDLYVMNPDGSGKTRLTTNPAHEWSPAWSADGSKIAFNNDRDGSVEIYVMNADGSGQTNLTNNPSHDYSPAWGIAVVPVPDTPPLVTPSTVPQVSAGGYHTCALKMDGTVVCWGYWAQGQSTVPAGLTSVAQVSGGGYRNCALKTDGTVVCWGDSGNAVAPAGLASVVQVSAGYYHNCALKTDRTVVCWGANYYGETTIPSGLAPALQVSADLNHTCALKADRTVVCWGDNSNGQATVPSGLVSVGEVSAGAYHNCALKTDGSVVCWGGYGNNYNGAATVPAGLASVTQVSAGGTHTCALKSDKTMVCWGDNYYGQATVPSGLASIAEVSAGWQHTCVRKTDGTVVCWGYSGLGQTTVPGGLNLTASPNQPPIANAGTDRTVEATSTAGASITLDGSGSSDSNGDVLTFKWTGPFGAVSGVSPTVILPIGTHTVTLTVSDGKTTATSTVQITVRDTTGPVITPVVDGTRGTDPWHTGDVAVSWTVVDNESAITSKTGCDNSAVTTNVSGQVHTCTAISAGGTATRSVTINRDATVPTVTATVSGTQGTDDWYTSNVQVAWTTSSAGPSGVSPPCAAEMQTTDTRGLTFTCNARTGAGIPGRGTVFVKRDGTAPVSTINSAVDGDGSAVASGGSTLSNSATFAFAGSDAYGIAIIECSLDAAAFTACLSPRTYSGQGIGVHTFRTRAVDLAGNSSSPATFTWTVITAAQAVQNLTTTITRMGLPGGVANSLSAPLQNMNTSNLGAACGKLDAFVNQVNAKAKNGQLTVAASSQLLEAASAIKKSLGCG